VAGRFSKRHKRCIREEDNKSNKQVIAKLLIHMSLLVLLVNAIIFTVITSLREDPLSPGILDMFFLKISDHSFLCKTELIYLKFHQIINSTTHQILSVGGSSSP
jgi:hypothetical protein